jgi:hypothetical protein
MSPIDQLITPIKSVFERSALEVNATLISIQAIEATNRIRTELRHFNDLLPKNSAYELLANAVGAMITWADDFPQLTPEDAGEYLRLIAGRNLVFHWSQVEAMVDDSIQKMILLDHNVESKLIAAGAKVPDRSKWPPEEWAKKAIENLRQVPRYKESRHSTVRKHAFLFEVLGGSFVLDPQYWNSVDEIDYLRNVLLHNNGFVDNFAQTKAPRLVIYAGGVVPVTDPLFKLSSGILNEYLFRLLMTLMSLPYVLGVEQNSFLKSQVEELKAKGKHQ